MTYRQRENGRDRDRRRQARKMGVEGEGHNELTLHSKPFHIPCITVPHAFPPKGFLDYMADDNEDLPDDAWEVDDDLLHRILKVFAGVVL